MRTHKLNRAMKGSDNFSKRRKKKYRFRPWVKIMALVLAFVLIGVIFVTAGGLKLFKGAPTSFVHKVTYGDDLVTSFDSDAEVALTDFLDKFYYAQTQIPSVYEEPGNGSSKDLVVPDMTTYFSENSFEQAYIFQTALKFMLTARTMNSNDLSLSGCKYDLNITSINENDNGYTIAFTETATVNFSFMKEIDSRSVGLGCSAVIVKTDAGWKIADYYREEDYYQYFYDNYKSGSNDTETITDDLDSMYNEAITAYEDRLEKEAQKLDEYRSGDVSFNKDYDKAYDRQKALDYALEYGEERNNTDYKDYSDLGGNCQNFGSQVVHAGGIPMDLKGDYLWKYYGDEPDDTSRKSGRSGSWTGAPNFHSYAKNNTGYGLVAVVNANVYSAEPGDILQVGKNGEYTHTNVVVGNIYNDDDQLVDVLLYSNTNNKYDWPMSAGLSQSQSLIKILGYNE